MPLESSAESQPDIALADAYLRGQALTSADVLSLAKRLKKKDKFGLARRVLARVRKQGGFDASLGRKLAQEHALCTYKDPDRPVLQALDEGLDILRSSFDLETTEDQETLGLAGAIYKRRWQATGQKDQLERSYRYYRRGYDLGPKKDFGYTTINAAFVLDQLADIELADGGRGVIDRQAEAKAIRQSLVDVTPEIEKDSPFVTGEWWYVVTVAEAWFGLGEYEKAGSWLARAKALPNISDWEFRSTASQLATLYQLQHPGTIAPDDPRANEANKVLEPFLGSAAARESAFIGKVGLALSGGGFRASLFHIGVLAKLAELDILRRVEVLSCVSGGSIVGAHYYLQLREKMETADLEGLSEDGLRDVYIAIVRRLAEDFLAGVQTNIRMRVFADPFRLFRSVWDKAYSRTIRLGELFESQLFARIWDRDSSRPKPEDPLLLKNLKIFPKGPQGSDTKFDPKVSNWRRKAKAPILILNATTLNTGHAWQYTASFMGESPWSIDPNIDGTSRLRRFYHDRAPPAYQSMPLSKAVVASACVPGLFEPLRLDNLYALEERGKEAEALTLRQVDGGVHDNQGVGSLLEQGSTVLLVSDASGQTGLAPDPGGGAFAPLLRSNSVLMERVRQEQYARLDAMEKGGLLKGLMFLHLKRDLDVTPIDWKGSEEPPEEAGQPADALTEYGVRKKIQTLLAGIRTDLDSFSDVKAFALMSSGYRMAAFYLPQVEVLPKRPSPPVDWRFLTIDKVISGASTTDPRYLRVVKLLGSGGSRMFRIWQQSRALLLATSLLCVAAIVLIGALLIGENLLSEGFEVTGWRALIVLLVAIAMVVPTVREHVSRVSIGLLGFALCVPAWLGLLIDRKFLDLGRVETDPPKSS